MTDGAKAEEKKIAKRYSLHKAIRANMGMEVLDYILGRTDPDQSYTNLNIPSFFPAGVPGKNTPTNKDYQGDRAYQLWMKRVKSIATSVGYEYLNFLDKKEIPSKSPKGNKILHPLKEGVEDKYIFKAIFLSGGPGSGKSSVISLDGKLMAKSVKLAKKQYETYLKGKLGIIIDGTGASSNSLIKKKKQLESLGYDTYMIFVNTTLKTALKRNKERKDRSLLDKIVERVWTKVQESQSAYKSAFGRNYQEVNTENTKEGDFPPGVTSAANSFISKPIKNREALKWISKAKNLKVM